MNCCAEEQGESRAGSGGVGFKVAYSRMWCPGVWSVIPVSGNSGSLFPSTLYIFGHVDTLCSLCFIKTQMRCCYLFSTTGIPTKELLQITIFILTPNFLVSLTDWLDTSDLPLAGVGYTVWSCCKLWLWECETTSKILFYVTGCHFSEASLKTNTRRSK